MAAGTYSYKTHHQLSLQMAWLARRPCSASIKEQGCVTPTSVAGLVLLPLRQALAQDFELLSPVQESEVSVDVSTAPQLSCPVFATFRQVVLARQTPQPPTAVAPPAQSSSGGIVPSRC